MPEQLEAELSLDLAQANRDLDTFGRDIEDTLAQAVSEFSDQFQSAVRDIGTVELPVDAQTETITPEIDAAIGEANTTIDASVDLSSVEDDIASLKPEPLDVPVTADTADAEQQVGALADALDSVSSAAADAQDSIDGIDASGTGLSDLSNQAKGSHDSALELSGATTALSTAFQAARGQGEALTGSLEGLGAGFGPAVAGGVALTAGFVGLFEAGDKSLAALERVKVILGGMADAIEHINIGGLSGSLSDLAIKSGSSAAGLRNASASAAQMGLSSGATKQQVVDFSEKVNALALRAVVLNPRLGDAGTAAERLNLILGRGGRFLARYGIDLNVAAINARALSDTGKENVKDLTLFEKASAGAAVATEKLGDKLGKDFNRASEQTSVQLKSIRAELNAAFAAAGRPLVEPTVEALKSLTPVATELSAALGQLAVSSLPLLTTLFRVLGELAGPLKLLSDGLSHIPGPITGSVAAFIAFRLAVAPIGGLLARAGQSMVDLALNMERGGLATAASGIGLKNLGQSLQDNQAAWAGAATGALLFASSLNGMGSSITDTLTGIGGLAVAGASIGTIFGQPVLGAAIGAATGGIISLGKAMFDAGPSAQQLAEDVKKLGDEIAGLGPKAAAGTFLNKIDQDTSKISDAFAAVGRLGTQSRAQTNAWINEFGENYNRVIRGKVDSFREEFDRLAKSNPAAAQRVIDGLRAMGDAVPEKELERMEVVLNKDAAAAQKHATHAQEAADANKQLTGATDSAAQAADKQQKALTDADTKLQAYAASAKTATDRSAEFGSTLEADIAPKVDKVGDVLDNFMGALAKFSGSDAAPDLSQFSKALTDNTQDVQNWINGVRDIADRGFNGLAALILQRGPDAFGEISKQIDASTPDQIAAWDRSLTAGLQGHAQAEQDAKDLGKRLSDALNDTVADPQDLIDAMKKKLAGIVKFKSAIEILVKEGLTGLAGVLEGLGAEDGAKYADGIINATPEVRAAWNLQTVETQNATKAATDTINAWKPQIADATGTAAEEAQAQYAAGVNKMPTSADEAMAQAEANIYKHTPGAHDAGHAVGFAASLGTANGFFDGKQGIGDAAGRATQEAIDDQIDHATEVGTGLGYSITVGIGAGAAGERALAAARAQLGVALDQLDAFAHTYIGSASPAKRFIPLGESITIGIGVGITKGVPQMTAALADGFDALHKGGGFGVGLRAPSPPVMTHSFFGNVPLAGNTTTTTSDSHDIAINHHWYGGTHTDEDDVRTIRRLRRYAAVDGAW